MIEIIRNMLRRKSRTFLTVFGIVIGIFALSVMGALAEKMNVMISGALRYYTGQITIMASGNGYGGGLLTETSLKAIRAVPGVSGARAEVMMLRDTDQGGMSFGMPPMVVGYDLTSGFTNRRYSALALAHGRNVRVGDRGVAVVGSDIAKEERLAVGDTYAVRGRTFKVVGVLARTLTAPDKTTIVPIEDARSLFVESQPLLKELSRKAAAIPGALLLMMSPKERESFASLKSISSGDVMTGCSVSWSDSTDPDKLAKLITKTVSGVQAMPPSEMRKQIGQAMLMFNLIITGSALIALIVGGLSVINTMTMAVSERTNEIGVKKALGARTSDILGEYLCEAAAIGLLGGLLGVAFGWVFVLAINAHMSAKGAELFMMTPRLVLLSLSFAVVLGTVSGIYPSLRAANLDCVQALREE